MSHLLPVAYLPRIVIATLCLLVHGCSTVDGGAVELSWKLRAASGSTTQFLDCDSGFPGTGPVKQIRLNWQVGMDEGFRDFACDPGHGVTGFDVPPGGALLTVAPLCANGPAAANTYIAPAPAERTVIVGNAISLGAVEIVLEVQSCDLQACVCQ
jgi:hypothetical protein